MQQDSKSIARSAPVAALAASAWPSALDTLVAAFADDPVAAYLFPDPGRRRTGMRHLFGFGLNFGRHYGHIDVTPDQTAVAVWLQPGFTVPSWRRLVRCGFASLPFKIGWLTAERLVRYKNFLEASRLAALPSPHWLLFSIGVRPDQQGRGLGAALLAHGLRRMAAGQSCYLETANPDNLAFYRRNGFRLIGDRLQPRSGPGIWSLAAEARPAVGCDLAVTPNIALAEAPATA
jgi:ribosomal protein S18 acetylase RimI-like enzyme